MSDLLVRTGFRVRKVNVRQLNDGDEPIVGEVNSRGDVVVAQTLPERSEVVRMGNSYGAQVPTGSAFAPVAAWPTTRAELILYNGELANGKTYVIDRVWVSVISSVTAAQSLGLIAQLQPNTTAPAVAAPANNTAVLRQSLSGNKAGTTGSKSILAIANTAFMLTNQWFSVGPGFNATATPNIGASNEAFVYGKYLVPPAAVFGLALVSGAATGTAICGIEWHEVQLDLS